MCISLLLPARLREKPRKSITCNLNQLFIKKLWAEKILQGEKWRAKGVGGGLFISARMGLFC